MASGTDAGEERLILPDWLVTRNLSMLNMWTIQNELFFCGGGHGEAQEDWEMSVTRAHDMRFSNNQLKKKE